jgi:protein-S-isoprenylcysteine O-methyltransferase Ste14
MRTVVNLLGIVITGGVWLWLLNQPLDPTVSILLAIGGTLGTLPLVWLGRRLLDAQPTIERALWVTTFVHYGVFTLLGAAIIAATQVGIAAPGWVMPLPPEVGLALMIVSGALALLAVANLALRGLGAPFAIALSRELAMDWLYAWTRNPMVLSALAFLIAVGLWLRSTLFVLWVIAIVVPAILLFLKVYEERELEIRFGEAYRGYKAKTPMLWPRRPEKRD